MADLKLNLVLGNRAGRGLRVAGELQFQHSGAVGDDRAGLLARRPRVKPAVGNEATRALRPAGLCGSGPPVYLRGALPQDNARYLGSGRS